MPGNDYLIEKRLYQLNPDLHRRMSESLFVLQKLLDDYLIYFPEFTDHSTAHSVAVLDNCNNLMGKEMISRLNADELYVLLMACYLHDIGMGISENDYREFRSEIDYGDKYERYENAADSVVIRAFHNEFSACLIQKYAPLFDIPTDEHVFAIMQMARGHRKTDLYDEQAYPDELLLENGNTVRLLYMTAILRLADEVNVAKDRNMKLTFDPEKATSEKQKLENAKHEAIKKMTIYTDRIELDVKTDDEIIKSAVHELKEKMQKTFDYCVKVVDDRTSFEITQKKVFLNTIEEEG